MQGLIDVVLEYIEKEKTSYAIFINGRWGTGKTHFWDKSLKLAIKENKKKSLDPIYVSLYGIASVEKISEKIFYSIHNVKSAADWVNAAKSVAEKYSGISFKVPYDKMIDYSKYVVCFDDLERVNMDIKEVLGYFTSLVDRQSAKIIIIGYEEELEKHFLTTNIEAKMEVALSTLKDDERQDKNKLIAKTRELFNDYSVFKRIKEKLIGKTIEFTPNFDGVIKEITSEYNGKYGEFLKDNISLILDTFIVSETRNLRILNYALDDFQKVYLHIITNHKSVSAELSVDMLKFYLSSAFEIMTGVYTRDDYNSYTSNSYCVLELSEEQMESISDKKGEQTKAKSLAPFLQKYYPASYSEYPFYPSIWGMIFNGIFDSVQFDKEIETRYYPQSEEDIVEKFSSSYWEFSDEEFAETANSILRRIEMGEVHFSQYPKLFFAFEALVKTKSVPLTIEELKTLFKTGMDIIGRNECIPVSFDTNFELFDKNVTGNYKEIKNYAFGINERLEGKQVHATINELETLLKTNVDEFCRLVGSKEGEYSLLKIFKFLSVSIIMEFVKNAENKDLIKFRNAMERRYGFSNISDYYMEETENLLKLKTEISALLIERQQSGIFSLKVHLILVLLDTISSVISRLDRA
ncbi:hypothetical protein AXX12_15895 [Anaerosporomusa subterranea]|uniref:Uncharacterized protein n=1 Tax=Anaerosporomusa subterranea TaxID=1794912 RepID=A0A154BMF1_ANASB|nr:P-loop NTPase fold protein [Anaerosporomusa subterranea]KYZ75055.1 hypothetical protein AXX12_15895 [Anaerosporomusa subterranea]